MTTQARTLKRMNPRRTHRYHQCMTATLLTTVNVWFQADSQRFGLYPFYYLTFHLAENEHVWKVKKVDTFFQISVKDSFSSMLLLLLV